MLGDLSANFDGNGTGNHESVALNQSEPGQLNQLTTPSFNKGRGGGAAANQSPIGDSDTDSSPGSSSNSPNLENVSTPSRAISLHEPFGITMIVGGTNVRFGISVPNRLEPIIASVTWRELKDCLDPKLKKKKLEFEHAKDLAFEELGKRLVNFVAENCPPEGKPPFHNVCAFNFSVAGPVEGDGLKATVTTTNTGVNLKGEALAAGVIKAINAELKARKWPRMKNDTVHVLNDAVAGAYGEHRLGALKDIHVGVFMIVGTGIGGVTLEDGRPCGEFSEFGHTVISHISDDGVRKYSISDGRKILEQLDEHGNFLDLPKGQSYIENYLAGPWFAINFVRQYNRRAGDNEPDWRMLNALAAKIHPDLPQYSQDQIADQLLELSELDWRKRQSWAVNSSSLIIKAINRFLLIPDAEAVLDAIPCTDANEQWRIKEKAEKVLSHDGFKYWKGYFKELGSALGALKRAMKEQELAPEKIVLGGGIAEACQKHLSQEMKLRALRLIHDHGRLKAETVVFSSMSPEAREAALTTLLVQEANEILEREHRWDA